MAGVLGHRPQVLRMIVYRVSAGKVSAWALSTHACTLMLALSMQHQLIVQMLSTCADVHAHCNSVPKHPAAAICQSLVCHSFTRMLYAAHSLPRQQRRLRDAPAHSICCLSMPLQLFTDLKLYRKLLTRAGCMSWMSSDPTLMF